MIHFVLEEDHDRKSEYKSKTRKIWLPRDLFSLFDHFQHRIVCHAKSNDRVNWSSIFVKGLNLHVDPLPRWVLEIFLFALHTDGKVAWCVRSRSAEIITRRLSEDQSFSLRSVATVIKCDTQDSSCVSTVPKGKSDICQLICFLNWNKRRQQTDFSFADFNSVSSGSGWPNSEAQRL